ncbi:MAG: hypothetical protein IJQ34_02930 [Kiritimatiellae bacterium]|nr:hypothetical protein [Kiritimatiellia bacterium]
MKKILFALLATSLFAISGCGPFWVDPYIVVTESKLNWVEIHYYNLNKKPTQKVSLYLTGGGYGELKKGTSELVSNDFAKHNDSSEWENIRVTRIDADPKHINDIFQNLVNYGLLDREKSFRGAKKEKYDRFIAVKANISNYTYSERDNIFEVDPDLAEQLLDVIREFESHARLMRNNSGF